MSLELAHRILATLNETVPTLPEHTNCFHNPEPYMALSNHQAPIVLGASCLTLVLVFGCFLAGARELC